MRKSAQYCCPVLRKDSLMRTADICFSFLYVCTCGCNSQNGYGGSDGVKMHLYRNGRKSLAGLVTNYNYNTFKFITAFKQPENFQ